MSATRRSQDVFCLFSAFYPPHIGGVESFTQCLGRSLRDAGKRVIIVTTTEGAGAHDVEDGVEVYRLPARWLLNGRFPLMRSNRRSEALWASLEAQGIDHVIVQTRFYPLSLEAVKFARKIGVKPIVIDHGSDYLTLGNVIFDEAVKVYEQTFTRKLKRYGPDFYGVSRQSARWLETFGIQAAGVIHNAIDAAAFVSASAPLNFRSLMGLDDRTPIAAFVGRLIPEKGVMGALKTAALMRSDQCRFVFAGSGPLEKEIIHCGLPNVAYAGPLESAEVSALLQQSDVLLNPSRSEGFCRTLLEAAACLCLPLTTPVGIAEELLRGYEELCLIKTCEPKAIASQLKAAIEPSSAISAAKQTLRDRAYKMFTWEATVREVLAAAKLAEESPVLDAEGALTAP